MAIKSMTGFGRGELEKSGRVWTAEVRCVNNRYLDLKIKLPRGYSPLEEKIRRMVAETHLRGRVDLMLSVSGDFSDLHEVTVNMALAGGYLKALRAMTDTLSLAGDITPQMLASYPDVVVREQKDEDLALVWQVVEQVVTTALADCDMMRSQEGKNLADDLTNRLQFFDQTIATIEKSIPELLEQRQKNLQDRLDKLLANVQLDPARLAQEVVIMADKTDVTEEIVRLRCHISQFILFLTEASGIGRKLDFLIQEFLREVNTLASKINDAAVAHLTVDLKSELEKMREQVQNIE